MSDLTICGRSLYNYHQEPRSTQHEIDTKAKSGAYKSENSYSYLIPAKKKRKKIVVEERNNKRS